MKPFRFEEPIDTLKGVIDVNIETGCVAIEPHEQAAVLVEGEGRRVEVTVSRNENVVYITSEDEERGLERLFGRFNEGPKVKMVVRIPAHCQVRLKTMTGTAVIENIQGEVRAEVVTGTLTLANLGDSVDAQVITGTILYDGKLPKTDNRFSATTGKVQLNLDEAPNAQVRLKTVTGRVFSDFELGNQKRKGSITGDHLSGVIGQGVNNLWAKTVTGTVHLKRRVAEEIVVEKLPTAA